MSVQEFALPDLPEIADSLFSDRCAVVITPSEGISEWATKAAWQIARAIAETGRRTALVDLHLDDPKLQAHAIRPLDRGIVDAFLFGASLQHVASQDENPNLHFIGVGSATANADEVLEHNRWERLSRGFRNEEAVLFLFAPTSALESLSLSPDLIIALSPSGFSASDPKDPFIRSAIDRGLPIAVFSDPDAHHQEGQLSETDAADSTSGKQRTGFPTVLGVVLAIVVVCAIWWTVGRESGQEALGAHTETTEPPEVGGSDSLSRDEATLPVAPTISGPVDTLEYSIQVAAWARLREATEHYIELSGAGIPATISAVVTESSRVWYRVFAGAVTDRPAATQLRERLRAQGNIGSVRGVLANTPYAYLLSTHPDTASGRRALEGLRESGIPAYIVSMPDGTVQVLFGAFESPDQADLADSVLPEAGRGLSRVLVTRVGIAR